MSATVCWGSTRNRDCILYPGKGTVVLIRPAQTFYERINNGLVRRTVIAFDIVGSIPASSTITSVNLTLNVSRSVSGAQNVELRRLVSDWGEGTSNASANEGQGTLATSGDATWLHRFSPGDTWSTPGGDFSSAASASTSVGGTGNYTWGSTSQMIADVQSGLYDPSSNSGWILIGNESSNRTTKRFNSRENSSNPPRLVVGFS